MHKMQIKQQCLVLMQLDWYFMTSHHAMLALKPPCKLLMHYHPLLIVWVYLLMLIQVLSMKFCVRFHWILCNFMAMNQQLNVDNTPCRLLKPCVLIKKLYYQNG